MKRKDVYVIFRSDGEVNGIALYAPYGECVSVNGKNIVLNTDLPWTTGTLVNATIYNLPDEGSENLAASTVVKHESRRTLGLNSANGWKKGEVFGFELNTERFLPDSVAFKKVPDPIVFHAGGGTKTGGATIECEEKNVSGGGSITLKVDPLTGWIE